jgi:prepilin-type N-terminal cleavage/methylation domain-containing protein
MIHRHPSHGRRGFTLTEILVVLGIMIALAAMIVPAISRAQQKAARAKMRSSLAVLATALDAYKADFQSYPPIPPLFKDVPPGTPQADSNTGRQVIYTPMLGAHVLCNALLGPASAVADGADGFGFRVRKQGQVYTYINPNMLQVRGLYFELESDGDLNWRNEPALALGNFPFNVFIDHNAAPILYFVANSQADPATAYAGDGPTNRWNREQNSYSNTPNKHPGANTKVVDLTLPSFRRMLGDVSRDGKLTGSEKATYTGAYILWSAGPDGLYGFDNPALSLPCDDVLNFEP